MVVPVFSCVVLGLLAVAAIFAPAIAPHDPLQPDLANSRLPPSWLADGDSVYFLGTDQLGRDVLSRVIFGTRISLAVALSAIVVGGGIGTVLGMVAAYFGKTVDNVIMRVADVGLAFPTILLAIVFAAVLGAGFLNVLLVVSLIIWPRFARQVRGEGLEIRELDYFRYAKAVGVRPARILTRHMLPNVLPSVMVLMTWQVGVIIVIESSLSFLGVGIPPPQPSWGGMVSEGRSLITRGWWISFFPGIALSLTVVSVNMLGDWLRDRV